LGKQAPAPPFNRAYREVPSSTQPAFARRVALSSSRGHRLFRNPPVGKVEREDQAVPAFACQPPREPTYSSAPSVMPSPDNPGAGASVGKTLGTSFCRASSIGFELGQASTSTTFQSSLQGGSLQHPTCICPPGGIEQQQGGTVCSGTPL